jgi:hypothetical protein
MDFKSKHAKEANHERSELLRRETFTNKETGSAELHYRSGMAAPNHKHIKIRRRARVWHISSALVALMTAGDGPP